VQSGLRREEEPFVAVAGRVAGELALLEPYDRIMSRGETEVLADAPEDPDAVVADVTTVVPPTANWAPISISRPRECSTALLITLGGRVLEAPQLLFV
jgi:hypothetical protein